MKYNYELIGERIRIERKNNGLTQSDLIKILREQHYVNMARNTLSSLENGNPVKIECDILFAMCSIFRCELGYLLGEYDCRTGRNTDIAKEIGISEKAIHNLDEIKANNRNIILSLLLENDNFGIWIRSIENRCDYRHVNDILSASTISTMKSILTLKPNVPLYSNPEDVEAALDHRISVDLAIMLKDISYQYEKFIDGKD